MPLPAESNGSNGRDNSGRFAKGNSFGRGNPQAKRAQALRSALFAAVTEEDVKAIVRKLVQEAKDGDTVAAREVLDRTIGKAAQTELLQRVETLESHIEQWSNA